MGERTEVILDEDLGKTLEELCNIIRIRRTADPEESYTTRLLIGPEDTLYKKVIEEAAELVMAAKDKDHDHIRYEAADLMYHLLVVLEKAGITAAELAGELKARMR